MDRGRFQRRSEGGRFAASDSISYRPDALFSFDTQSDSRSFATPRTWEYVNEVIASEPDKYQELSINIDTGGLAARRLIARMVEAGTVGAPR